MRLPDLLSVRILTLAPRVWVRLLGLVALTLTITATYVAQGALVALVLATSFDSRDAVVVPLVAGVAGLALLRALLITAREVLAAEAASMPSARRWSPGCST